MKAVDYSLRTGTGLQETTAAPLKALPREPSFLRRKVASPAREYAGMVTPPLRLGRVCNHRRLYAFLLRYRGCLLLVSVTILDLCNHGLPNEL
jgi:hypothetical protein